MLVEISVVTGLPLSELERLDWRELATYRAVLDDQVRRARAAKSR